MKQRMYTRQIRQRRKQIDGFADRSSRERQNDYELDGDSSTNRMNGGRNKRPRCCTSLLPPPPLCQCRLSVMLIQLFLGVLAINLVVRDGIRVGAYEVCVRGTGDEPGFYCPTGNTCCRMLSEDDGGGRIPGKVGRNGDRKQSLRTREEEPSSWGCVASDMGARNATCCTDDGRLTGCPSGYECRLRKDPAILYDCVRSESSLVNSDSKRNSSDQVTTTDPLMGVLPRYRLCRAEESNRKLYGLPVPLLSPPTAASNATTTRGSSYDPDALMRGEKGNRPADGMARLAYYSNLGPIDGIDAADRHQAILRSRAEMALIVVHGANRNADDYFCSAKATIELQTRYNIRPSHRNITAGDNRTEILVVAPFFLPPPRHAGSDIGSTPDAPTSSFLYWDAGDRDGPWRFGADASGPVSGVSSFDAMDALVRALARRLPNLRRIVVAGHSSGGQFVQRWSLLTPEEVWPPAEATKEREQRGGTAISIHAIVANPSNYVYLTPERFWDNDGNGDAGTAKAWRTLSAADDENSSSSSSSIGRITPATRCPEYNRWEWGLDDGGDLDVPYRRRAFSRDDRAAIVDRYLRHRSVVYLIGNLDRCSEPGRRGDDDVDRAAAAAERCDSHGLETTCMDELQGRNRYERNARYWSSLDRHFSSSLSSSSSSSSSSGSPTVESSTDAFERTNETSNSFSSRFHRHRRIVVPNSGHDHSMMFQSREGIFAIYDCCGEESTEPGGAPVFGN